ncbi:MAG: cobyric acid synthase [Oscillospiraceae bacterium]|nr:cobyric acid synthase [Oscillospiraceae bacterium]
MKSIMIQGTMSGAGKSLLCAALCRIFAEDGHRTAPFKSQNMALNSFITDEGLEIGRAQAMQAEAAGIAPSVLHNPILLKPTSDKGSQVIVNGEVMADMSAREYFRNKKALVPHIKTAFDTLAKDNDIIVIEGAGSPVELNLLKDDMVNMGMAEIARSPVLLVGNIDPGGVFAQLLGTLSLLDDKRSYVKGLVVNRFRGDITLFDDGVKILEKRGGVPVAGVIPYIKNTLDDEDSLSDKLRFIPPTADKVNIAVVRLPKMSNYTDFDAFSDYDDVRISYVTEPYQLDGIDMIVIPGSKSVIADMAFLRETGLAERIRSLSQIIPVFGVCGGYQLLGKSISDPYFSEEGGESEGLGLLPVKSVFERTKQRTRISGTFGRVNGVFSALSGAPYEGYEIHMGQTAGPSADTLTDTGGSQRENIYGTYVHGIFDRAEVSSVIIKALCEKKNIPFSGKSHDRRAEKERQYKLLADTVRKSLDMELVYRILDEGI